MFRVRRSNERGYADHGWLKSFHTFSFAAYQNTAHIQFRALRVMNEDRVAPGQGFGTHPHEDMEIVTYVLEGALEHRDSMGNGAILRPGEFQRMSAGTGITHSEFNPSPTESVHLYQIWLRPESKGITPSYEQKSFPAEQRHNQWQVVAASDAANGALKIHQDAQIFLANLDTGVSLTHEISSGRHLWLQVLRGSVVAHDHSLSAGDGLAVTKETALTITATDAAEVMLFDLA